MSVAAPSQGAITVGAFPGAMPRAGTRNAFGVVVRLGRSAPRWVLCTGGPARWRRGRVPAQGKRGTSAALGRLPSPRVRPV